MLRRILLATAGALALTGAAAAADLGVRPPPPPYVPPPPPPLWTGFYAGLNAGYGFGGNNNATVTTVPVFINTPLFGATALATTGAASATGVVPLQNHGFIGGGQVGYNFQLANSFVVGVEADIQGTGIRDSNFQVGAVPGAFGVTHFTAVSTVFVGQAIDYLGTVRGRLGWLITPTLLLFGSGGFAYGGVHQDVMVTTAFPPTAIGALPAFGSFTNTETGWTAGGGLEWMFMPNWSVKAEYLYYDLGRTTFGAGALTRPIATAGVPVNVFTNAPFVNARWNGHIARAGLNYHFFSGAPPVVAKY